MNRAGQVKIVGGGQVAFVFRLPTGQVEFSVLFLTLQAPVITAECHFCQHGQNSQYTVTQTVFCNMLSHFDNSVSLRVIHSM